MSTARTTVQEIEMEPVEYSHLPPPPPYAVTDPIRSPVITQPVPVVHQTIIVQQLFRDKPVLVNCPSCHKRNPTTIKYVNSKKTHLIAGCICGLTFWCLLCCLAVIPYMMRSLKAADHYCSNCNYYLGTYSKL
ncbi:unnamed protein product [Euphydryas editha]|uniref:LITAF domain-containing protein n=1 Tax=Euphydryas editha TaxID=104508 RepID=A0AAU9U695_EUPED|nr:unnamed protein product [Euphydryas editha]